MARPRAELPPPEAIRAMIDRQGRIAVRVTPGSRSEGIAIEGGQVMVKVRARPQDGEANDAVVKLLAAGLGVAKSRLALLRGGTSREKLFQLT